MAEEDAWLRSEEAEEERGWWKRRLSDVVDVFAASGEAGGRAESVAVCSRRTESEGSPQVVAHLTALAEWIRTATATRGRIALGLIVSGRAAERYEATVGPFLNTVCVPLTLGSEPVSPMTVAESLYESLDHSRLPFDEVVAALGRRPSPVHPVCQVLLVPQAFDEAHLNFAGICATRIPVRQHPYPFNLVVETWLESESAIARFAASRELVEVHLTAVADLWATRTGSELV